MCAREKWHFLTSGTPLWNMVFQWQFWKNLILYLCTNILKFAFSMYVQFHSVPFNKVTGQQLLLPPTVDYVFRSIPKEHNMKTENEGKKPIQFHVIMWHTHSMWHTYCERHFASCEYILPECQKDGTGRGRGASTQSTNYPESIIMYRTLR